METFDDIIKGDKPVLVDFFATWCGPCKVLSPTVEALGKELAGQVRVLKIDVDKNEALATQLRIQSVPTLIIFKKGEIVWRSSGVMDHGSLLRINTVGINNRNPRITRTRMNFHAHLNHLSYGIRLTPRTAIRTPDVGVIRFVKPSPN